MSAIATRVQSVGDASTERVADVLRAVYATLNGVTLSILILLRIQGGRRT
jgi:hypothetical protein